MKIFVINLERDKSKKDYMTEILTSLGLEFEFIEAIDGNKLSFPPQEYIHKEFGRHLTKGETGTILSHKKALNRIQELKLPQAVIMEDDVILDHQLKAFLGLVSEFPSEYDVILMGHHTATSRIKPTAASIYFKKYVNEFELARPCELALGAYGYIVSRNGIKKLISEMDKMDRPADWFTGSDKSINLYLLKKPIVLINDILVSQSNLSYDREIADNESLKNIKERNFIIQTLKLLKVDKFRNLIRSLFKFVKPIRKYS